MSDEATNNEPVGSDNQIGLSREQVTKRIMQQKVILERKWKDLARQLSRSVEWTVTACLGQMQFTNEQARIVSDFFDLRPEERVWLEVVPYKNTSNQKIPSDPLLYRLYEVFWQLSFMRPIIVITNIFVFISKL